MPTAIAEALAVMTTLIATGSFILIGFKMRMGHRERMAQMESGSHDGQKDAVIDALRNQVDLLSDEVTELNERMDFTERLLTQGRAHADRDGVTTPV